MTYNFFRHKLKGSALLLTTIVTMTMISAIAVSLVKLNSAASSALFSNKEQMQAQQYALSEASLLRAVRYSEMDSMACTLERIKDNTQDTKFFKTVLVDSGTPVKFNPTGGSGFNVSRKTATIKIFHENDTTEPLVELKVPHYVRESKPYLPIGAIVAWAGSGTPNADYGKFFECANVGVPIDYPELISVLGRNITPDFRDKFLIGGKATEVLTSTTEYGLPNITGEISKANTFYAAEPAAAVAGNAFADNNSKSGQRLYLGSAADGSITGTATNTSGATKTFDASRCSSIYKNSLTNSIEVPSVKVRFFIKAE